MFVDFVVSFFFCYNINDIDRSVRLKKMEIPVLCRVLSLFEKL